MLGGQRNLENREHRGEIPSVDHRQCEEVAGCPHSSDARGWPGKPGSARNDRAGHQPTTLIALHLKRLCR
jgi:hypothetical protein